MSKPIRLARRRAARWPRPCRRRRRPGRTGSRPCRETRVASASPPFDCMKWRSAPSGKPGRDPVDVAAQDRRQIGVDHGRVAAPDQLDQRRDLVADRDLRKAELARDFGQPRFMIGDSASRASARSPARRCPARANRLQRGARLILVERTQRSRHRHRPARRSRRRARRASTAGRCGARKSPAAPGSRCASASPKPARDRQRDPLALALEQRIGGDRRAHADLADRAALLGEDAADRLQRGVVILARIFRQQLFDPQPAVRRAWRRRR